MWTLVILVHCYGIACVSVNHIDFPSYEECKRAAETVRLAPSPKASSAAFCKPAKVER